jgi:pilus assembly protein CpaB
VGSLSLVLRNQIDPNPALTTGATKTTLLGAQQAQAPAPAPKAAAPVPRPAPVRKVANVPASGVKVEMIKGLDRSSQQF